MANAKKLTESQIAALRAAARGQCHCRPYREQAFTQATIAALRKRGLLGSLQGRGGRYPLTPAGRHALFEATGENCAPPEPTSLVGSFRVEELRRLEGEDVLLGTVALFRTLHHFQAVKVARDAKGCQVGTRDPHHRFSDVAQVNGDGALETVELPGFDGEWVLCIYPFAC